MLSKDQLYWGGFLAADGCVDGTNRVRLYLSEIDIDQLHKFKAFIGKPHKIQQSEKYKRVAFEFTDAVMCRMLQDTFNITPRKSLTYELPNLSVEEMKHFLRGYFDGDGCICESFSNKNSKTATLYTTFVGSVACITGIRDFLKAHLGIDGPIQDRAKYGTTGNSYLQLKYSTNKSLVLLKWLYADSDVENRLDRKYDLYHKIIVLGNRLTR